MLPHKNTMNATFRIRLAIPVEMTASLQGDIIATVRPRWRIEKVEMQKIENGVFELRLSIPAIEFGDDPQKGDELQKFRDLVVSLIAFCAMAPVELRSKGTFNFPMEDGKGKAISLGPMNYEFPPTPLNDLAPLATGMGLSEKYSPVLHFLWQGLNSTHALYRFINLAIAVELLVRHDSPVSGSRHPKCADPKCGYELAECPECEREWNIPATLRERSAFLFSDSDVLHEFIHQRNKVFHALTDDPHSHAAMSLPMLNARLLLTIRNYLGREMQLPAISHEHLSVALERPDIIMTVDYTEPA